MPSETRLSLLAREEAHGLMDAIRDGRPHAELLPVSMRLFGALVHLDNGIAEGVVAMRRGVSTTEMLERARRRDAELKRRRRAAGNRTAAEERV